MVKYMANPRAFTLKKWFYDLMGMEFSSHDTIIERVSASLTTQQDLEEFGKLVGHVYEKGYRKALEDYKKEAEKHGLTVSVQPPS